MAFSWHLVEEALEEADYWPWFHCYGTASALALVDAKEAAAATVRHCGC